MSVVRRIRIALRGGVSVRAVLLEAGRRARLPLARRRERALLDQRSQRGDGARLAPQFARLGGAQLLEHFRGRLSPRFLPGFQMETETLGRAARERFPSETEALISEAREIVERHRWPLLGYGVREFGQEIDWLRDPLSGVRWPLDFHAEISILRGDGSDLRVLWELNRLSHLLVLARAYALTGERRLVEEFFAQLESWRAQNPVGYGANWMCAMEAALRAINLLASFELLRRSPGLSEERLRMLLALFDEHGAHIRRNLEFSHFATGNHYLSDVVGLLWLGLCLPELEAASEWRDFALGELRRELRRQVLPDGANYEGATGYHRLVLELFLYSFILYRAQGAEIEPEERELLRAMLRYLRAYLRPDGRAPLVGDADSGQVLPLAPRGGDDHAYLLAVGAAFLEDASLKIDSPAPFELLWLLGEEGVGLFESLSTVETLSGVESLSVGGAGQARVGQEVAGAPRSEAFRDVGIYIMRQDDLYLLFNATDAGLKGRGSHGHNDALSIEVAACGLSFLSDAGTYVYTANLEERHLFRSTAYHSTVEVDAAEQNTTEASAPFVIGNEAAPRVLRWQTDADRDYILAEHDGYARLPSPVTHARAVTFEKRARYWLIRDTLTGAAAEHTFRFRFHLAPGREASLRPDGILEVCDKMTAARLWIVSLDLAAAPSLEPVFSSRDYGAKTETRAACWTVRAGAPLVARWALIPICAGADEQAVWRLVTSLKEEAGSERAGGR